MRYWFGGTVADWTIGLGDTAEVPGMPDADARETITIGGTVVTAWNSPDGGSRYTDLLDEEGAPVDSVVSKIGDALGHIPPFQGPDGVRSLYVSANGGPRVLLLGRVDAVDRAGDRMVGPLLLQDGFPAVSSDEALLRSGGTMAGPLRLAGPPTHPDEAVTKAYVDAGGAAAVTSVNGKVGAVVLGAADVGAAAAVHGHALADVTGLVEALAGKASTVHTHPGLVAAYRWDEVSGAYVAATGAGIYTGPADPGAVPDGSIWVDTSEDA